MIPRMRIIKIEFSRKLVCQFLEVDDAESIVVSSALEDVNCEFLFLLGTENLEKINKNIILI